MSTTKQLALYLPLDGGVPVRLTEDIIRRELFPQWYKLYPRHVGRDAAERAFVTVLLGTKKTPPRATFDELMAGVRAYVDNCLARRTEEKYIAHPTTHLNQGRWKDEYGGGAPSPAQRQADAFARAGAAFRGRTG